MAQPRSTTPQASLDEVTRLDQAVESLYKGGKFQEAIPFAEQSLELREKALGAVHPDVAESLNNLAALYQAQGAHARAESLYVRALTIREKALGAMHPDVAISLNNLATLYRAQGAYARAEPLLVRALAISEKAQGAMHPDVATSLNNLATLYQAQGAYARAEPLLVRALAIREKALGEMHPDVAISLNSLATRYHDQGAYARAEPLMVRALAIREKTLGELHPDVAESLNNLAVLYQAQGAYARAEPLYIRALAIQEKAQGAMHPDVAGSLNNLAMLYQTQGVYTRAEPLMVRALAIREKTLGAMHPDVAISLSNLAVLCQAQGAYARAEPLMVRALAIRETALGGMHPAVATSLNNLAGLYREQGAYARAEPLLVRALAIREKALGGMHPDVAIGLNNLAEIYLEQGAYARAEPLLVRALAIREKALGAMHPAVANSLTNQAGLYLEQGAYARAEPFYVRALAIHEKALGPMHPAVATDLSNLAELYRTQGAYVRAEPLHVRALAIREKALGAMHPNVATSLNNLAWLYKNQGAYARAEPLYVRALAIWEKALGAMHPNVATSLNNIAWRYQEQGAYARAAPLLVRALDIREKALGGLHPAVAQSLNNLAKLYWAQGAYARAEPLYARVAEIGEAYLRIELARLSESRKRALMRLLHGETESLVSFHAHAIPASAHALELALTTVLRRKGRILDSLTDNQAALRAHLKPQLRDKLGQLADASAELSMRLRAPYDPRNASSRASERSALRARIDDLEAELNAASAEFRVQSEPVTVAKVQAALPRGAALVELVRYRRFDARQAKPWQEARYLAYLLPWQGPPQWIALGDAAAIDARVDAVLATMHKDSNADATKAALRSLDALLFAPIRGRLAGVSHVILSPDGKLNLVPFEALIDAQGRYALEQWLISYVTSGRDLLRLAARRAPRSPATIVADPDYGPGTAGKSLERLPGTLAEAQAIEEHLRNVQTLTRGQATKAALAGVVGPAVLHIATHGFYARGGSTPARPVVPERGMFIEDSALPPPPPPDEDPAEALDLAGLALAGANTRPEGIASARELASYDWWGTQLVVLSACQTGVGAVRSGEGVYGMRRALVLAGARSQVVSLWNVNDSSAPQLMREFYGELARGTGRAQALRQAKLRILSQKRFAHPYYWAAFIPAGDWTPLDTGILQRQGRP